MRWRSWDGRSQRPTAEERCRACWAASSGTGNVAGPGDELFGVLLAGGELGGCGVGEGFLVEAQAAAGEPEERVGPQGDEQDAREGDPLQVVVGDVGGFVGEDGGKGGVGSVECGFGCYQRMRKDDRGVAKAEGDGDVDAVVSEELHAISIVRGLIH